MGNPEQSLDDMVITPIGIVRDGTGGLKQVEIFAQFAEGLSGLVAINGCSHPGIVKMLVRAGDHWKGPIYLSLGGYHLGRTSRAQIEKIVREFRELGVKKVAPTHCSGDLTRALFKEAYGDDFIQAGVGKVIEVK